MWKRTYSKTYPNLDRKSVWALWVDINNWPQWHDDLEYCTLDGPFAPGNYFMLKPKDMAAVKIVLTHVTEGYSFTDCTTFFGAKMFDTHLLEETPKGLRLTNTLTVSGPLKWLWIFLVARNVAASVPVEMEALATLAKKKHV